MWLPRLTRSVPTTHWELIYSFRKYVFNVSLSMTIHVHASCVGVFGERWNETLLHVCFVEHAKSIVAVTVLCRHIRHSPFNLSFLIRYLLYMIYIHLRLHDINNNEPWQVTYILKWKIVCFYFHFHFCVLVLVLYLQWIIYTQLYNTWNMNNTIHIVFLFFFSSVKWYLQHTHSFYIFNFIFFLWSLKAKTN